MTETNLGWHQVDCVHCVHSNNKKSLQTDNVDDKLILYDQQLSKLYL